MAHKVRSHHWLNGILTFRDEFFETLHEAIVHSEHSDHHNAKVYNEEGVVVHYVVKGVQHPDESYAAGTIA
jgi:hypothetical protein